MFILASRSSTNETRIASTVWGSTGAPNSRLPVMGQDGVLQEQQRLLGEALDGAGLLADQVAAHQDVPDQAPFLGVSGLDGMVLQLAELADVVEDDRGDDHPLVEGRIEVVVVRGIVLDQETRRPWSCSRRARAGRPCK